MVWFPITGDSHNSFCGIWVMISICGWFSSHVDFHTSLKLLSILERNSTLNYTIFFSVKFLIPYKSQPWFMFPSKPFSPLKLSGPFSFQVWSWSSHAYSFRGLDLVLNYNSLALRNDPRITSREPLRIGRTHIHSAHFCSNWWFLQISMMNFSPVDDPARDSSWIYRRFERKTIMRKELNGWGARRCSPFQWCFT